MVGQRFQLIGRHPKVARDIDCRDLARSTAASLTAGLVIAKASYGEAAATELELGARSTSTDGMGTLPAS